MFRLSILIELKLITISKGKSLPGVLIIVMLCFTCHSQGEFNLTDSVFVKGEIYRLKEIRFSFHGNDRIYEDSKIELDRIAVLLKEHTELVTEISTHTDSRGSDSSNLSLSKLRAEWLKDYLVSHGVEKESITAKGYGESQPLTEEKEINAYRRTDRKEFERLHQMNRRCELKIIKVNTP